MERKQSGQDVCGRTRWVHRGDLLCAIIDYDQHAYECRAGLGKLPGPIGYHSSSIVRAASSLPERTAGPPPQRLQAFSGDPQIIHILLAVRSGTWRPGNLATVSSDRSFVCDRWNSIS